MAEARNQIFSNPDPEAFEAAGRHDAEVILGPLIKPTDTVLDLGCGIGRVARYVALLEAYCRSDPYNWFNFYDFWHGADAPALPAPRAPE